MVELKHTKRRNIVMTTAVLSFMSHSLWVSLKRIFGLQVGNSAEKSGTIMKRLLLALVFLALPGLCDAATYFVSSSSGNDANNGLSEAAPWRTLTKVTNSTFQPGDQIL